MSDKKAQRRSVPRRRSSRADNWSRRIGGAIEARLQRRRDRIAEFLAIDPNDTEWRNERAAMTDDPDLSRPARGRPEASRDFGSEHLAQALADIYLRHAAKHPTRRRHSLGDGPQEYGPYKEFVALIVSIIPASLRR